MFFYLKSLFQDRTISKHYQALVHGVVTNKTGTIDAPLGKLGTKQTTQLQGKKDLVVRDAVTDYVVLKKFENYTVAIESVSHTLSTDYKQVGLVTPEQIMRKYTPSNNGSWANGVSHFMDELQSITL